MAGALITGSGKRIGTWFAEALAADGYDLALHFRASKEEAEELGERLSAKYGVTCVPVQADLARLDDVEALIRRSREAVGTITLLINNASLFESDELSTLDNRGWQGHMDVNLQAPVFLSRDFARELPKDIGGHIVNLLDQKVANLRPDYFSYTVSKAALHAATHLLAIELAPRVRVNAIAPGLTLPSGGQTQERFEAEQKEALLGLNASPEMLVDALRYLNTAPAVTGQVLYVDGGDRFRAM